MWANQYGIFHGVMGAPQYDGREIVVWSPVIHRDSVIDPRSYMQVDFSSWYLEMGIGGLLLDSYACM